ncbi:hypothetical protein ILYODFUR_015973 [Ilyodon furcidens]|uniref:Uncharacterized protein n=1 Tax=Ilyodon furcidens TaxID=33524 RepID=A0ABV0VED5_9TELE
MDGGRRLGQQGKALASFGASEGPYDVQLTNTAPPQGVCRQDAALHHPFLPPGFTPSAPLTCTLLPLSPPSSPSRLLPQFSLPPSSCLTPSCRPRRSSPYAYFSPSPLFLSSVPLPSVP